MNERAIFWQNKMTQLVRNYPGRIRLMEVCGSHSVAIAKYGLRNLLPEQVSLASGPGCPVCVSAPGFIDLAAQLAKRNDVELFTFGDLLRIPGGSGSFLRGSRQVHVIYSPAEILDFARQNPGRQVVFAAVGFEPTLSAAAAFLAEAAESGLDNLTILADFKNLRPVLDDLAADNLGGGLNGFLLPGHVASVVGEAGFAGIKLPGVIAGFDPEGILRAICKLLFLIAEGRIQVLNDYNQVVSASGNEFAQKLIREYFQIGDGVWRGIGEVRNGAWKVAGKYADFDALRRFDLNLNDMTADEHTQCRCGEILRGHLRPDECPLFGLGCKPEHPVGSCMVSEEGACMAEYYHGKGRRKNG